MIEDLLKKIGLSGHEALVYGTLLRNSPSGASFIAKQCNLSRSTVYTVLSSLIAKGLVGTTYKNEIKQFVAEDISTVQQLLSEQQKEIKTKLAVFDKLEKTVASLAGESDLHIPQIIFFEGQEGLKKIYLSMLREANKDSTMLILRDEFVWQKEWSFVFESAWQNKIERWKKELNITTKLLVNSSEIEKKKRKNYQDNKWLDFRYLPVKNKIDKFVMYILGDVVSIMSMENNNLVGIKITNKHFAKNFKNIFDILWIKSG